MTQAAQVNTSRARRKWLFTGLVLVVGSLTVTAGFWQLQRADDKRALLASLVPTGLVTTYEGLASFDGKQSMRLEIAVDDVSPDRVFLENRIVDGRAGYEVFVRAQINQIGLLVNAGWVPAERTRAELPTIVFDNLSVLRGLWVPLTEGYMSGQAATEVLPGGRRVQSLRDVDFGDVRPGVVLAEGWLPITAKGPAPSVGVMTHIGYAVQWFAMTAAVIVAWIWWMRTWGRRA